MKHIFKLLILFLALSAVSIPEIKAEGNPFTFRVTLHREPAKSDDVKTKNDNEGNRAPSRPIFCTISAEGIQMDVDAEDIQLYEIWDADGELCIASYTEESDFINALFSLEGEYQIQFTTEDYTYIGYVTI